MPAINTCAFALSLENTHDDFNLNDHVTNDYNLFWVNAGAPPCSGNARVVDLYTGQNFWLDNCAAGVGRDQALCVY